MTGTERPDTLSWFLLQLVLLVRSGEARAWPGTASARRRPACGGGGPRSKSGESRCLAPRRAARDRDRRGLVWGALAENALDVRGTNGRGRVSEDHAKRVLSRTLTLAGFRIKRTLRRRTRFEQCLECGVDRTDRRRPHLASSGYGGPARYVGPGYSDFAGLRVQRVGTRIRPPPAPRMWRPSRRRGAGVKESGHSRAKQRTIGAGVPESVPVVLPAWWSMLAASECPRHPPTARCGDRRGRDRQGPAGRSSRALPEGDPRGGGAKWESREVGRRRVRAIAHWSATSRNVEPHITRWAGHGKLPILGGADSPWLRLPASGRVLGAGGRSRRAGHSRFREQGPRSGARRAVWHSEPVVPLDDRGRREAGAIMGCRWLEAVVGAALGRSVAAERMPLESETSLISPDIMASDWRRRSLSAIGGSATPYI